MKISLIEARDLSEAWFLCLRKTLAEGYQYKIGRGSYAGQRRKELDFVVVQVRNPGMTAHRAEGEQYTYGQYLEKQISEVIRMYKEDGHNTNQAFMAVGDSQSIFLLTDPPCLRGIDTRVRYGKLHFIAYFRSWDLWAGFPSNLAAMQLLKEYMASEIGVGDGELMS